MSRRSYFRTVYMIALTTLYIVSLGAILYYALEGRSYYFAPIIDRPHHADYWQLKPGGTKGLLFGVIGSSLMILMLTYSLRKRIPGLRRVGNLRSVLDLHIFCGITGPLWIVLHSSLKIHGLVALSFWSMVIVALSGVLGKYLYVQFPRRRSGAELSLREIEERDRTLGTRLQEEFNLEPAALDRIAALSQSGFRSKESLLPLLFRLPIQGLVLRWKLRLFRRSLPKLPPAISQQVSALVHQKAFLQRRIIIWSQLHQLFYYWHVLHKPFALVMYLFMILHIITVTSTGYGWVRPG